MVGLFAGIGGIEEGFRRALGGAVSTDLLCEWWEPAKRVLEARFPDVELHPDVRNLKDLPQTVDVVAAGFPCTDLSQAGRTAGIRGTQSGLVTHVFEMLSRRARAGRELPTLFIENVPNMLSLDKGEAMRFLVEELERLGYQWAYRVVDTRFTGLPQRRRRVLLIASTTLDPKMVLFANEALDRPIADYADDLFGFYWTEGRGGLGWAPDAVPTLKGGSSIGIASPPAIWVPGARPERALVVPSEDDMEALQGFDRGWTNVELGLTPARHRGTRGKMVGNAVSTRVAEWVASQIADPGEVVCPTMAWGAASRWPTAAAGGNGERVRIEASEYPVLREYEHLGSLVNVKTAPALSSRAVAGFRSRLSKGNLGWHPGFREAVAEADLILTKSALLEKGEVPA